MIDYEERMKKLNDKKKKLYAKKKENEEKIALKIGVKILKDFDKKIKGSGKPLTDILGVDKITNSVLVSYILSCYLFDDAKYIDNQKNIESSVQTYENFLDKFQMDFAEKYNASDVLQYADINQIIQLGVLLARAIGRPADMAHVEKYLLNSGSKRYIENLGVQIPAPEPAEIPNPDKPAGIQHM